MNKAALASVAAMLALTAGCEARLGGDAEGVDGNVGISAEGEGVLSISGRG